MWCGVYVTDSWWECYNVTLSLLWHNTHGLRLEPWLVSLSSQLSRDQRATASFLTSSQCESWEVGPTRISTSWLLPSSLISSSHFRLDITLRQFQCFFIFNIFIDVIWTEDNLNIKFQKSGWSDWPIGARPVPNPEIMLLGSIRSSMLALQAIIGCILPLFFTVTAYDEDFVQFL